ncbi:MAG: hypothetical protein J2P17_14690 [Mycobacterium sp.]|nr:hypothetical protein [Mycobacterium sp.]
MACSSVSLCVAVDSVGAVHATSNPGGGATAWNSATLMSNGIPLPIGAVACVPGPFCVLTGGVNGQIWTSSAPTVGAPSWSQANTAVPLYGVSCPSAAFCAAVDDIGNVLTSTSPPATPWHVAQATEATLLAIACPNTSLCVATDIAGNVVTSTNPTGSSSAWTTTNIDGDEAINGVSCPSAGFCAAVDDAGNVLTATNPADGPWTLQSIDGATPLNWIDCPSSSFCVAVDDTGELLVSTAPTTAAWTSWPIDTGHAFLSVSCVSISLCVAGDDAGRIFTSTAPASTTPAWTGATIDNAALNSLSCQSTQMCVAVDADGYELNSINPAGGADEWTLSEITFADAPAWGVACPVSSFCEAVDGRGDLAQGGPTPSNLTPPTITGASDQGAALTVQPGMWTDAPTSLQHQWERCDASGVNCADIASATGGQYALAAADVGHTIRVLELASNANGDGAIVESAQTAVVGSVSSGFPGTPTIPGSGTSAPVTPSSKAGSALVKGASTRGTIAKVRVSCAGGAEATCSLTLRMTVLETIKTGKVIAVTAKAKPKRRVVVLGRKTIKLAAGETEIAKVSLNSVGKRLLSRGHTLNVNLTITESDKTVFSKIVTFKTKTRPTKKL